MEKEEIKVEAPTTVAGVTLVPVVRTSFNYWKGKNHSVFFSSQQPLSVAVIRERERKAFRISGEEVPFEQLVKEISSLEAVIQGL